MEQKIESHKINKPIQLLAAWLVGLILVNGSFLATAKVIEEPIWLRILLVIASIVNVPGFLISIFLLQTKFRAEMQEDSFYAEHLKQKYNKSNGKVEVISEENQSLKRDIQSISQSNSKIIQVIESVQDEIINITNEIELLEKAPDKSYDNMSSNIKNIRQKIYYTRQEIDETRKEYDWKYIDVELNNLLDNFTEIKRALNSRNIKISNIFGSSSRYKGVPSQFLFSFGTDIPVANIQEMINILLDYGLDSIQAVIEPIFDGNMYIGSYGYKNMDNWMYLNEEIVDKLLDPEISKEEFFNLVIVD